MAIICVTYDLKQPGRDYTPVHAYLRTFTYCKGLESFWLLDTQESTEAIRDRLRALTDANDVLFVCQLARKWNSWNYQCGEWLNDLSRSW